MNSLIAFTTLLGIMPGALVAGGLPGGDIALLKEDTHGPGNFCHVWTDATWHDYFALQIETIDMPTEKVCDKLWKKLDSRSDCNIPPGDEFYGCANVETRSDGDKTIYTTWWWWPSYKTCNFDTPTWVADKEVGIAEWVEGKYWCSKRKIDNEGHRPSTLLSDDAFDNFLKDLMAL